MLCVNLEVSPCWKPCRSTRPGLPASGTVRVLSFVYKSAGLCFWLLFVCLFVMAAGKRPRSPQCCCRLSSAKAASGSQRETWGAYSQAPQQASCAWFGGSASYFPQVAFSKSHNILCVSVARADAARPRIETFLPRRNDSQAGRPASLSDNRLSHTTEHFKMPFPKNTKNTCKNPLHITYLCPGGWYLQ